jgi:hypothetical protein
LSCTIGFDNLEQSRTPLWMIPPILELPDLSKFSDNFFESIFVPSWQPIYNN